MTRDFFFLQIRITILQSTIMSDIGNDFLLLIQVSMTWIGQDKKDYWHAQVSAFLYHKVDRFDLIFTLFYCVLLNFDVVKDDGESSLKCLENGIMTPDLCWDVCGRHRLACRWIPHLQQDSKRFVIGALLARKPIPLSRAVNHLRESSNSIESTLR